MTEVWFPAHLKLEPHRHDRGSFATILEGSFDLRSMGRSLECLPSTVLTEPLGNLHGNRFGNQGAHVLVMQPDPQQEDVFYPCRHLLDSITHIEHGGIRSLAWRLAYELRAPDSASGLAMQGIGFDMLATAARLHQPRRSTPPAWLTMVEDYLRAHYLNGVDLSALATEVDTHPTHLSRVFRQHYREPISAFVRRLRLEWAATQLATSGDSIAHIAQCAGFSDQSHFTRAFKQFIGLPPGRYRRALKA
ncbi:MAG: helix-turn-helix transcriptional regulator [Rhodothermaceae bacterium]|nr:helix-turn-helix transcriptional regulator [Rhodothermaceae bacterium]